MSHHAHFNRDDEDDSDGILDHVHPPGRAEAEVDELEAGPGREHDEAVAFHRGLGRDEAARIVAATGPGPGRDDAHLRGRMSRYSVLPTSTIGGPIEAFGIRDVETGRLVTISIGDLGGETGPLLTFTFRGAVAAIEAIRAGRNESDTSRYAVALLNLVRADPSAREAAIDL